MHLHPSIDSVRLYGSACVFRKFTFVFVVSLLALADASAAVVLQCTEQDLRSALATDAQVQFACTGTITLLNPIQITTNTVIDGSGGAVVLSGNHVTRLFDVAPGAQLTLVNLGLADAFARASGGAIYNDHGTVSLVNVRMTGNAVSGVDRSGVNLAGSGNGGAIYNLGQLTASNTVFSLNQASGGADALDEFGAAAGSGIGKGGAVYNGGSAFFTACTFSTNSATGPDGATATGLDEFAEGFDGGTGGNASGGAIYNLGSLVIDRSTLVGNTAGSGRGGDGANGIYGGNGGDGGTAAGGAVAVVLGSANITNSTLVGNRAQGDSGGNGALGAGPGYEGSGGAGHPGLGGGLYSAGGATLIFNCTLAANDVSPGPGIIVNGGPRPPSLAGSFGSALMRAAGTIGIGKSIFQGTNYSLFYGAITDLGFNLCSDASLSNPVLTTHVADPMLGSLADNGGPCLTIALKEGSPALDAISAAECAPTDGRGFSRPQGTGCDIGAFEGVVLPPLIEEARFIPPAANAGDLVRLRFTVRNPNSSPLSGISLIHELLGDASFTGSIDPNDCGALFSSNGTNAILTNVRLAAESSCTVDIVVHLDSVLGATNTVKQISCDQIGSRPSQVRSSLQSFGPPLIETIEPFDVSSHSAVFGANVNTRGIPATVYFEYGSTTNYGSVTSSLELTPTPDWLVVTNKLEGLASGALYNMRAVVESALGKTYGADQQFFLPGNSGFALNLNGVNQAAVTPYLERSFPTETETIELWFRPRSAGVLIDERGQADLAGWQASLAEILSSGEVVVRVWSLPPLSVGKVSFNQWHHLALRYNKSSSLLDGVLDGIPTSTSVSGDRSAPFESGLHSVFAFGLGDSTHLGSGAFLNGDLDEIRIWNVARSNAQIQGAMHRQLSGLEPGLVGYWQFDQAPANAGRDLTTNHNDLILLNQPPVVSSSAPVVIPTEARGYTFPASNLTTNSAILNGLVLLSQEATFVYFEFGLTTGYGFQTPEILVSGVESTNVSMTVSPDRPGTYHFRVVITNESGISYGSDESFVILPVGSYAVAFEGAGDLTTPELSAWLTNDVLTLELWFNASRQGTIIDERGQLTPGGWAASFLEIDSSGQLRARVHGLPAVSLGNVQFGQWHHAALRYSASASQFAAFLDGVLVATVNGNRSAPVEFGSQVFYRFGIGDPGNSISTSANFAGQLDEIRIWAIARSDEEISQSFGRLLTGNEQGLVLYWPMQNGPAIADATPHSLNGSYNQVAVIPSTTPLFFPRVNGDTITNLSTNSFSVLAFVTSFGYDTTVFLEWASESATNQTAPQLIPGTTTNVAISAVVSSLTPGSIIRYHFVAQNDFGVAYSGQRTVEIPRVPGHFALSLDGVDDAVITPDLRSFFLDESMTIELWFNAGGPGVLIDERGQMPPASGFQFTMAEISPAGDVLVRAYNLNPLSLGKISLGEWHHLAVRYDKSSLTLDACLDGVPSSSTRSGDRISPVEGGLAEIFGFGLSDASGSSSTGSFNGSIDEVRIWSQARRTQDIERDMGRTLTGLEPGLVLYWTFDEGTVFSIRDRTSHSNAGALLGAPTYVDSPMPVPKYFAVTDFASFVSANSAVLNGYLLPAALGTQVYFEWGDSTNVPNRTPPHIIRTSTEIQPIGSLASTLAPGTVYYFRLVSVTSNNANRGELHSFVTLASGPGRALNLPGGTGYMTTPDLSRWLPDETMTIELWFKSSVGGVLVDERGQSPPNPGWQYTLLEMGPSGLIRMRVYPFGPTDLGQVSLDQWHHVALRFDKSARHLDGFLDGVKVAGVAGDRLAPVRSGVRAFYGVGLADGANMGSGGGFTGEIDEVRIWNTARSDQEIRVNRFRRFADAQPGLIANWRFDENSGTATYDSSGLGNHGLLSDASRVDSTAPTFDLQPIVKSQNGQIRLQFLGEAGLSARLETSTDLIHWSQIYSNVVSANNLFEFQENSVNQSSRFYRFQSP